MDADRPAHPLGPDAPTVDYVGIAFSALGFSLAVGLTLNAVVSLVVRTMQAARPPATTIDLSAPDTVTLLGGTFLACLAAAIATWRIMARVHSPYRQGMLAMVSFFGSFVVSMIAWPVDRLLGRPGLIGLVVLGLGLTFAAGQWVGREVRRL